MKHSNQRASAADPFELLRDDIVAIKKDLTSLVSGRLNGMSEATKDTIAKVGSTAQELAETTEKKAKQMHKELGRVAADRPLTTIVLAVAAGAVGAKLMGWMLRK